MKPEEWPRYLEQLSPQSRFHLILGVMVVLLIIVKITSWVSLILLGGVGYTIWRHLQQQGTNLQLAQDHQEKVTQLSPPVTEISQHPDLTDFFYSIQEWVTYNPQAYREMVKNVESFLLLHQDLKLVTSDGENHLQILEAKMRNALNALHSLVFSMTEEDDLQKLTRAHRKLSLLLQTRVLESYQHLENLKTKLGYHREIHPLNPTGPKAYNTYLSSHETGHTYEFY